MKFNTHNQLNSPARAAAPAGVFGIGFAVAMDGIRMGSAQMDPVICTSMGIDEQRID
jgi:hypothetical protein